MCLTDYFDAVLMLTWSDWKTEPRSNRYHYATRFARSVPVLFFQHSNHREAKIAVEPTALDNIDLVNTGRQLSRDDILAIKGLIAARGIMRPLIWVYDPVHYSSLIDALPLGYLVYHATEDYFAETTTGRQAADLIRSPLVRLLQQAQFLVACSQGVAESYVSLGGYAGPLIVSNNGCDAEFLFKQAAQSDFPEAGCNARRAIFQGGINQRLDYDLLHELIGRMPDWEFRFCGAVRDSHAWRKLLRMPNVKHLGELDAEGVAEQMCASTVGIIPFKQEPAIRNSLPLKAYEYVACGLPVVTVPVAALEGLPQLFSVATTSAGFADEIRRLATSRNDPELLAKRLQAALANSYERRFAEMEEALIRARQDLEKGGRALRGALLYDAVGSLHVSTIREHLESFRKYSVHHYTLVPATTAYWQRSPEDVAKALDFSIFDFVVVHYSVRVSTTDHFDEGVVRTLKDFDGLRVLFLQDEYEGTEIARTWMESIRFDIVFTCVPKEGQEKIYPSYRFPATVFLQTLTGYVPEDPSMDRYARPLAERKLAIAYRGRRLPAVYGQLGQEKYRIGVEMNMVAGMRGIPVDIEVDDTKRIYGTAWYEFLGSARATLGTESGSNVFDFDGSLRKKLDLFLADHPETTSEEIGAKFLLGHEGCVAMNQISPKIFEAIRLRTALILFEGKYSGVLQPDVHFISLKKDFSNIDEVIAKLLDDDYIRTTTERAFNDIVASGAYSYRSFIKGIDAEIEKRVLQRRSASLLIGPLLFRDRAGRIKQAFPLLEHSVSIGATDSCIPGSAVPLAEAAQVLMEASQRLSSLAPHEALPEPVTRRVRRRMDAAFDSLMRAPILDGYRGRLLKLVPNRFRDRLARRYFRMGSRH